MDDIINTMLTGYALELPIDLLLPLLVTLALAFIRKRNGKPVKKILLLGFLAQLIWIFIIVFITFRGAFGMLGSMG